MTPRVKNPFKTAPDGIKAMMALEASIKASGLEHGLLELVKLRASQLNGCAFCIHMHATDARARGESEMRLYMLNAWRESPLYTRSGTGGAGLDGGPDAARGYRRAGCGLRPTQERVHRERTGQSHLADRGHQSVEPAAGRSARGSPRGHGA